MPDLFSEFRIKDVTLRNRIAVSPMTMFSCDGRDGILTDWHIMHLGARAAGGAGLVVMEQVAVSPEGRMTPNCAGIWSDDQIPMLRRVASFIKSMGAVPGIQLGHTGRKGGMTMPWDGYYQLPEDHPDSWEAIGPTDTPYGGKRFPRGAKYATKEDIARLIGDFARGAERALEAGFELVEMHYAHGFLGANFLSPVANRARFLVEAFDAVRAVWPERLALTMRVGAVDFGMESHSVDDTITLVKTMVDHGLDLVDISMAMNTDAGEAVPWTDRGFMVPTAARIRSETGIPTAVSWNVGDPDYADRIIRDETVDVLMLGRPMIANPHWALYAALALGRNAPYDILPNQYSHALQRSRDAENCGGFGPINVRREGAQ